ncbi:MAG: FkbM family methyltransferase, partial [Solirubrobacteraceae bacterium]
LSEATPVDVPTTTLDETLGDAGPVRFLKIDVEGAELAMIRGGKPR